MELIFEIRDADEGGYYARALGHSIFTKPLRGTTSAQIYSKRLLCTSKMTPNDRGSCKCTMLRTLHTILAEGCPHAINNHRLSHRTTVTPESVIRLYADDYL